MVSIPIGLGASKLLARRRDKTIGRMIVVLCLLTVPAYIAAPKIAKRLNVMTRPRKVPYRDDYSYFLRPWKTGERGAERFAEEVLAVVEPEAIIFADTTTAPPLLYAQQVKARRADVKIISSIGSSAAAPHLDEQTIDKLLAEKTVYVVSPLKGYCPDLLFQGCTFEDAGIVHRAVPK